MFRIGVFVYYWDNEKGKLNIEFFIINKEYIPQLNTFINIDNYDHFNGRVFKVHEVHNYPTTEYIKEYLRSQDYSLPIPSEDEYDLLIKVTL